MNSYLRVTEAPSSERCRFLRWELNLQGGMDAQGNVIDIHSLLGSWERSLRKTHNFGRGGYYCPKRMVTIIIWPLSPLNRYPPRRWDGNKVTDLVFTHVVHPYDSIVPCKGHCWIVFNSGEQQDWKCQKIDTKKLSNLEMLLDLWCQWTNPFDSWSSKTSNGLLLADIFSLGLHSK